MDVEKLWEVLYKERNTASLQELPERFCEDVRRYISRLEAEKAEADDTRRSFVEDEIRNARMKVEDIMRRRIGKIIKLASSGMDAPSRGMLPEEREIFQAVKRQVEEGKAKIFASIFGGSQSAKSEPEAGVSEEDEPGEEDNKYELVRILDNIPAFVGTDGRVYKVGKEDVIMLPRTNAEVLCNRGVAMRFEAYKKRGEGTR